MGELKLNKENIKNASFSVIKENKNIKQVLICVDLQNDFITGALANKEAEKILPRVVDLIKNFDGDVIFTRDTHDENYLETNEGKNLPVKHCIMGTHGWQIADGLETPYGRYINKPTFGWMGWKSLEFEDEIEIVGLCTDICVVSNALILKAMFPEVKITVDASCCAGVTPETHKAALQTMKMCQINVIGE